MTMDGTAIVDVYDIGVFIFIAFFIVFGGVI
jgi:hypothetical protein